MTGKRGGLEPAARKGLTNVRDRVWAPRSILCVLLGSALFFLWSCAELGTGSNPPVRPDNDTKTSDPTEAQLLERLNKKFEDAQAQYELARLYHKAQNWNAADYRYSNAIAYDPAHKGAQAGWVKLFLDRGDPAKAEQFANGYILNAATSVRETLRLGWEFRQLGLDEYALRCFRQALNADPNSFEACKQIGFYYRDKGDAAKAKEYLLKSFNLNPRQPEVAGALGKLGVIVELPPAPPEPVPAKPK